MHLLVIEDERALCETIVRSLRRLAYSVDYCYRCYDSAHRVGDGVGKERFCQRRVVVDLLAQPPREVGVKVPQRQVNEMGDRRLSHICRHPEGRKVRTHEAGEIDRRA